MMFDQKLKDLLRLQTTQPDAFTAELNEPWPGMQSDIELALGILEEYQRRGSVRFHARMCQYHDDWLLVDEEASLHLAGWREIR
jgi:hypothetical protein